MDANDAIWEQVLVDRLDSLPPYQQIAATIRHKIATAQIAPGTPLPSIRKLASTANVTTATVSRAYRVLQDERLIETHAGVGTVVADVTAVNPWLRADKSENELHSLIGSAVTTALELGHGPEAILRTVLRHLDQIKTPQHVLFVCGAPAVARRYERILTQELGPLGIRVSAVTLSDLQREEANLERHLSDVTHIVTMLSFAHDVEQFFRTESLPISILLTELSIATSQLLRQIPAGANVVFVAEQHYRTPGLGMLQPYCRNAQLAVARSLEPNDLSHSVSDADIVVHTLGTSDIVKEVIGPHHQVIELEFQLRSDSLRMLKEALTSNASL